MVTGTELTDIQITLIDYLIATGALKLGGPLTLKSKRSSPYFINTGSCCDAQGLGLLAEAYCDVIKRSDCGDFGIVFGPASKGIPLAVAIALKLGGHTGFSFDRKEFKDYGEATGGDLQKQALVGMEIKDGVSIIMVDDVLTTAATKIDALNLLNRVAEELKVLGLFIAVDRQEVGIDGNNAVSEFTAQTGIPVFAAVTASQIYQYLNKFNLPGIIDGQTFTPKDLERMANYLRVYGTVEAREVVGKIPAQRIIEPDRSVIPACDVKTLEALAEIVKGTADNDKIGGYKIGFTLALSHSLTKVVETIRQVSNKTIIYDHQKAGTDIPDTGRDFAQVCADAGVDAIILFPQSGPETERAWIYHALNQGLKVIVGGRMTHPAYSVSEGGFITDKGALEIYRIAAQIGVTNFVVPGNKPEVISEIRGVIEAEGIADPALYAPGFVAQGGKVSEAGEAAGNHMHAIAGRAIYTASDIKAAAAELTSQL